MTGLEPNFTKKNYEARYVKRPGGMDDGSAIFYNKEKLKLLISHPISYNETVTIKNPTSISERMRCLKNNVALFALFETIQPETTKKSQFVVANTHLYWDPKLSDVKLRQSHSLLEELQKFLEKNSQLKLDTPTLICGDFNCLPESGMYELYSNGTVSGKHPDMLQYNFEGNFNHKFKLKSAFVDEKEPITNYTIDFKGTLDYIWYSRESFSVESLLSPFTKEDFSEHTAIPSPKWSSDHTAIAANFCFKS